MIRDPSQHRLAATGPRASCRPLLEEVNLFGEIRHASLHVLSAETSHHPEIPKHELGTMAKA